MCRGKMMPNGRTGASNGIRAHDYANLITLEQELETWHSGLPDAIKWKPANLNAPPMSFFHLQLVLIQYLKEIEPFAEFDSSLGQVPAMSPPALPKTSAKHHCVNYSQNRCLEEAIFVSRILNKSRGGLKGLGTFVTNIEHASVAGATIVASILSAGDSKERIKPLKHLYSLIGTLQTMLHPASAKSVAMVLQRVIDDNGWDLLLEDDEDGLDLSSVYAQRRGRGASNDHYERVQTKRQKVTNQETSTAQRIHSERLTDDSLNTPAHTLPGAAGVIGTEVMPIDISSATTSQLDIAFDLPSQWNQENDGGCLSVRAIPDEFSVDESFLWNFISEPQFDKHLHIIRALAIKAMH
ncbi:nitrogen assimilation transcription factor nit-4 [Pyrenophora seminiperda CCB06]|uniref:Nitrogen assimilation transcription factor nit-4 n=1 Tax=Pyrenophora seminiperda CCB06 TaxID=1302712 RepID=A0A3M7M1J9_9PLEO|nr:nitrogen assimilation transcription factor nit-4 [Pyrenophora seminiperda CCB06]